MAYVLAAVSTAPIWLSRLALRGRLKTDWASRFGRCPSLPGVSGRPRVLIHAVSVGEVNAARHLVEQLAEHPSVPGVVISVTTDTGFARAQSLWAERIPVVRYPLDFSWAVDRFLNAVNPDVVALMELEVWPNFVRSCEQRGIPVCVVNGRLSRRSARRYRLIAPAIRPSFSRLAFAAVQTAAYATRFHDLGVPRDRLQVTGTMKWDTSQIADHVPGSDDLAREMGIDRARPLIVAGSTAPDEHRLLAACTPGHVQLLCAPRRPEWFDAAAHTLSGCARRSRRDRGSPTGRFLLDSIGELRAAYALADIVIVGRSFGSMHGSDMIEPVALGKATIVGPAVSDFQDAADALLAGDGLVQTTASQLGQAIRDLLDDPERRRQLASNGRQAIRAHQGSTARHVQLIGRLLEAQSPLNVPAPKTLAVPALAGTAKEEKGERRKE